MSTVLVDTGVWYAIFDSRDRPNDREAVERLSSLIEIMSIVVPWPIAYETLRTKFVRNRLALELFERRLKSPNVVFVDDAPYRNTAFDLSLKSSLRGHRPLSMVDCMLRMMLDEANTKIRYLATYNEKDFFDVCARRNIELLH
jgi:predicted nucleic acid-binding protein